MCVAPRLAPLRPLVSHVVGVRTKEKMSRITARSPVASVKDVKPVGNLTEGDRPDDTMSPHLSAADLHDPVAVADGPGPVVAPVLRDGDTPGDPARDVDVSHEGYYDHNRREVTRFRARVRIHAGTTYEPGAEIPETVAMDGLTEGVEYDRG
jgi:hypothetical protein